MTKKDDAPKAARTGPTREDRLKQALKANLARRKAQARARTDGEAGRQPVQDEGKE